MNMFKTTDAKTPEEYIERLEEPRKAEIQKLHDFIRKTVPDLEPFMISGMIGYGSFHYTYASGREGDWAIICLASQKNYISLYACATKDGQYVAEHYKDQLPKADIGRSCIRFKDTSEIDMGILKEILQISAKEGGSFEA